MYRHSNRGALLYICCQVQARCCRIGKFKKYFRLKVVYVQVDTTDMQDIVLLRGMVMYFVMLKRRI
jgi:hypothetical protein